VAGDFIGFRDASSLWLFSAKTVNVEMGKPQQRLRIGGSGVGPTHRQRLIADRSAKGPRTPTGRARMTVGHDCCGDVGHRYEGVQTSRVVPDWRNDTCGSRTVMTPSCRACARAINGNGAAERPARRSSLCLTRQHQQTNSIPLWPSFWLHKGNIDRRTRRTLCMGHVLPEQRRALRYEHIKPRAHSLSTPRTDLVANKQTSKAEFTTTMSPRETTVSFSTPMPKGYGFLPKGIRYKTLHCRKLTHDAGKTLYIVVDAKKQQLGLRVPNFILHQVHRQAKETLPARRAAVEKRDAASIDAAAADLEEQFHKMPEKEKVLVLKHGFRKHSGRVGRTGTIPLPRKVLLAVIAHVRHRHTKYDSLLAHGMQRLFARKAVNSKIESIMRDWGYVEGRNRWRAI
jgi:hypothetical protein